VDGLVRAGIAVLFGKLVELKALAVAYVVHDRVSFV
jgi:hypothetical protein